MSQVAKTYIVAKYTFKEMLKSKILWNVALLGLGIAVVTFVASEFTFGVPHRVALDLGLGSLSVSSYGIAILIGLGLIKKEEESRTIYLIISRPVSRVSFLAGKLLGVCSFLALNLFILSLITIAVVKFIGGEISSLVLFAMLFSCLESTLLLLVVVFLSLIANTALALMGSILVLISGHALAETTKILFVTTKPWLKTIVDALNFVFPAFHRFNLKDYVLYQNTIEVQQLLMVVFYWLAYVLGLFFLSALIINKKNMD
jgi:ABC-2 type transport system permease protein